jgi:hypothetical protein
MRKLGGLWLFVAFFCFALTASALETKEEQKVALDAILAELKTHYGMIKFKAETFGVNYDALRKKYARLIDSATTLEEYAGLVKPVPRPILSEEDFRQLMIGLGAEFRDGHTNILRQTDKAWTLGLRVAAIDGRLYVTGFRDDLFKPSDAFPRIEIGDEIVSLDGVSVQDLAKQNLLYVQSATYTTRYHRALELIPNPSLRWLRAKETGAPATLKLSRPAKDKPVEITASLHWMSTRDLEELRTFQRYIDPTPPKAKKKTTYAFGEMGRTESYFNAGLQKLGLPAGSIIDLGTLFNTQIQEAIKAKKAGLPCDEKLAALKPITRLPVYLVRYEGKQLAVLRVPDYHPADLVAELKWLNAIIPQIEGASDALIIDQLSNGGGYIYHFARFLSHFATNGPMKLGTMDAKLSETMFRHHKLDDPDQNTTNKIYGDRPNFVDLALHRKAYEELRKKFEAGEKWSGPVSFFTGGSELLPGEEGLAVGANGALYTKPLMVLSDQRSGSGGDFMPSAMQANKRGIIFGETSMGLGGPVYRQQDAMPGSEMFMRCTWGFCLRADGMPIENIGVVPDVERNVTLADLKEGFSTYAKDALGVALKLAKGEPVPTAPLHALPVPTTASAKVDKLLAALKTAVAAESDLTKLAALYKQFFADTSALGSELSQISEEQWRAMEFPLPAALVKADVVLGSLTGKQELLDRLADLKRLPRMAQMKPLVETLVTVMSGLRDFHVARRCSAQLAAMGG